MSLWTADGGEVELKELNNKKVFAFCGIGNPDSFVASLRRLGAEVAGQHFFSDHANYDEHIVEKLTKWGREGNIDWLVTTEKDWVKLKELSRLHPTERENFFTRSLHWLKIKMVITEGKEQLSRKLEEITNL